MEKGLGLFGLHSTSVITLKRHKAGIQTCESAEAGALEGAVSWLTAHGLLTVPVEPRTTAQGWPHPHGAGLPCRPLLKKVHTGGLLTAWSCGDRASVETPPFRRHQLVQGDISLARTCGMSRGIDRVEEVCKPSTP